MKLATNEIYTFKLTSGEEVIAKLIKQDSDKYLINKPLSVAMGQEGMQLIASVFTGNPEKNIEFYKTSISMVAETRAELETSYIEATTGIKPAQKQIITG